LAGTEDQGTRIGKEKRRKVNRKERIERKKDFFLAGSLSIILYYAPFAFFAAKSLGSS